MTCPSFWGIWRSSARRCSWNRGNPQRVIAGWTAVLARKRKGDRLCGHVPFSFPRSKGILPGLLVAVGLQTAVPVVGHGIALLRTIRFRGLAEHDAGCGGPAGTGFLMPAPALFPSRLRHTCHHLNRVHFETVLKANSVCSVNPSLDVYFNSVSFL